MDNCAGTDTEREIREQVLSNIGELVITNVLNMQFYTKAVQWLALLRDTRQGLFHTATCLVFFSLLFLLCMRPQKMHIQVSQRK